MRLLETLKELALCKKRLQERMQEVGKVDADSLKYDILLMEIEMLKMLIASLQGLIAKQMKLKLSTKTRKAVFFIKPTIN